MITKLFDEPLLLLYPRPLNYVGTFSIITAWYTTHYRRIASCVYSAKQWYWLSLYCDENVKPVNWHEENLYKENNVHTKMYL